MVLVTMSPFSDIFGVHYPHAVDSRAGLSEAAARDLPAKHPTKEAGFVKDSRKLKRAEVHEERGGSLWCIPKEWARASIAQGHVA